LSLPLFPSTVKPLLNKSLKLGNIYPSIVQSWVSKNCTTFLLCWMLKSPPLTSSLTTTLRCLLFPNPL